MGETINVKTVKPVAVFASETLPVRISAGAGIATEQTQVVVSETLSTVSETLTTMDDKTPALGAAVTADSLPVNIASDQIVPIEIKGHQDNGDLVSIHADTNGHLEVAVHSPRTPFGALHTEYFTPIFQTDGVYGLNEQLVTQSVNGTGTCTTELSALKVSTGATINSFAVIQSRKRLRYRPGQGSIGRFAGLFSTGVASSILVAGFGHSEDGFYFGYNGTSFGILHVARGVREVRTLTITTASTTNENVTVRLNGTNYSVAVTNSGNIQRTVWEISQGTYAGWKAEAIGATVLFIKDQVGTASGTYSLTATTAVGAFAQTKAGAASTDTWVPQASWNGDTMDGNGPSGVTLDPTKGNVYQIDIQYLGFGTVAFQIEAAPADGNNATFVTVHTLKFPNSLTNTHVGNPSFPFTMAAYSAGSTTDLSVKIGSFGGFIEGEKVLNGPRVSYNNTITTVGAVNYQALFTVRNSRYYGSRSNQSVINVLTMLCALKHTQPAAFFLIRNGALGGNPNFATAGASSCAYIDTSATTVTPTDNTYIVQSIPLAETGQGELVFPDDLTLQPGEWITLACRATTGAPAYAIGTINTREDQ